MKRIFYAQIKMALDAWFILENMNKDKHFVIIEENDELFVKYNALSWEVNFEWKPIYDSIKLNALDVCDRIDVYYNIN